MPVPVALPHISYFEQSSQKTERSLSLCETLGIENLLKVNAEDRKVPDPQRFFKFPAHSRYRYLRLLGHGAYGYVWYYFAIS